MTKAERTRLAAVYLRNAALIANGDEFRREHHKTTKDVAHRFYAAFSPWLVLKEPRARQRQIAVIMLCLAAAMAEAGDLP